MNEFGTVFCGIHALRQLAAHGLGVIVQTTSGGQSDNALEALYAAPKGSIASLTYNLTMDAMQLAVTACEYAPIVLDRHGDAAQGANEQALSFCGEWLALLLHLALLSHLWQAKARVSKMLRHCFAARLIEQQVARGLVAAKLRLQSYGLRYPSKPPGHSVKL